MPRSSQAAYDGYYNCSAECWSVFTEVIGAEFENAVLFGRVHQLSVDSYAVQHAGGAHPDKSVAIHLVGLHLALERGLPCPSISPLHQRLASTVDHWPHFEPPPPITSMTVFDVATADSPLDHAEKVEAWAKLVWNGWREHHPAVASLASGLSA